MPFPGGVQEIFMFGPLRTSSSSQLAPSPPFHYFSDVPTSSSNGQNPFPLRSNGFTSAPPKAPSSSSSNSLLSSRKISQTNRASFERSDSLGETASSGDSDDEHALSIRLKNPRHFHNHRRNSRSSSSSILKQFAHQKLPSRKAVKFADDVGLELAQTHLFADDDFADYWEPDPVPRTDYDKTTETPEDDLVVEISEWQVNFSQPAADYLGFREKLEANNVALENVMIKQKSNSFMGTIKVRNVSFKKDVSIRCSFNNWETFCDYPGKFCGKAADANDAYDTFSFEISIPEEAEHRHLVEFCICFRADGKEFWDSNQGKNYQLITSEMKRKKATEKHTDAYLIDDSQASWGEFASWNRLQNYQPYW